MSDITPNEDLLQSQLQEIGKQIAEEEAKLHEDLQRLHAQVRDIEHEIHSRKREFAERVRPLRYQHEAVVNHIVRVRLNAMVPTTPFLIVKDGGMFANFPTVLTKPGDPK